MMTREDLDRATCAVPGCDHKDHQGLFLHPRCHIGKGVEASYAKGVIVIRCHKCKAMVVEIAVAP